MTTSPSLPPSYYPYKPLSPEAIRVLELHPGPPNAPLSCTITTQYINGTPYEALSYVWGDPSPFASIQCNDEANQGHLSIGKGLTKALIAFRLPDHKRRIWVDALCINQQDVAERQSQVRLMGSIYEQAQQVLCWLGPFPDPEEEENEGKEEGMESRARLAIDFLRKFNENKEKHLQAARQHLHSGDEPAETDASLLKSWLVIKELFDLEYFHRAWIIQEVGLARHARLFWGTRDVWLDWKEVATFCRFMDDNGASVINEMQLKSWVANHINLVWETDSSGSPIHNFVEVLHWARVHRSTDPRDYIYALLSHPSATIDGSLFVSPDYRVTPAEAYMRLALNVIERTNSLLILAFVDHHEEPGVLILPTWVPDWHALNLVAPLRCPTKAATETSHSISFIESQKGMALNCRGFLLDTVQAMTNMIDPSGLIITTPEKELKKKIPFLVDHIWKKLVVEPGIPFASLEEFIFSLSLVLTGGYLNISDSTSGEYQRQQRSDFAALVLEYEVVRDDGHSDSFLASLSSEEKDLIQKIAAGGSAHQFVQDMTWTSMCRRVFRTAKGHIGLGPRTMRRGDVCVVLLGAAHPMVLRSRDDAFELVGPALVYGFMNGEAEKLCQAGVLLERDFQIL